MANIRNYGLVGVGADVQFGKNGAKLVQSGGIFGAKDAAGSAFVRFQVATPTANDDAATKLYVDTAVTAAQDALQAEVDATQAGAGLGANGAYVANTEANYISAAISLADADDLLDAALKAEETARTNAVAALQTELDATQTGAGLNTDGTYVAATGANYIAAATSLADADVKLDAALKAEETARTGAVTALQTELDATQAAVGLNTDGTLTPATAWNGLTYLTTEATIVAAIGKLDETMKANADAVTSLGNAFNYVGTLEGAADEASATDLDALPTGGKDAGDYYKVATAGYFKYASTTFYANQNDGLVKNLGAGWDIIDNTNSTVAGTADFITVTGSADTGFTVDVAATFKDRVTTLETEAAAAQTAVGLNSDGTLAAFTGDYVGSAASFKAAVEALDVAAKANFDKGVALQTELDATQAGAGLNTDGTYAAAAGANYIAAATSLADADAKLDTALKALSDSVSGLDKTRIYDAATTTFVDVDTVANKVEVAANGERVALFESDAAADSYFSFDSGTAGEVRVEAVSATATDVDIRLVPQGAGQVIIGESGAGVIQAETGQDLTVAGGAGADLILKGANVLLQNEAGANLVSVTGADSGLAVVAASTGVTVSATGAAANLDVKIAPKGTGVLDVDGHRITNVSTPVADADAVNKAYVDTAINSTANAGAVKTRVVSLTETTGSVNIGDLVTGTVVRVKVIVTSAFTTGATITIGKAGAVNELASAAEIDEAATGIYLIETAKDYASATQLVADVTAGSGSTGAAKVVVEYVQG